jgi:DNA-binding GntR family transcriptional regulator
MKPVYKGRVLSIKYPICDMGGESVSTAGERAYEVIRAGILSGQFQPGRRLKEEELTELCDVSRTPVREALRRLAVEGLVSVTPNAGAQVNIITPAELEEIYILRAMLESHAAERAAQNLTPEAIARLTALATEMERTELEPPEVVNRDFTPANTEFHKIIMDAAMSPRLSAMASLVVELPLILRTLSRYSDTDRRRSMAHHRELIDAFLAKDGAWAGSVMKTHIRAAFQALVRGDPPPSVRPL